MRPWMKFLPVFVAVVLAGATEALATAQQQNIFTQLLGGLTGSVVPVAIGLLILVGLGIYTLFRFFAGSGGD